MAKPALRSSPVDTASLPAVRPAMRRKGVASLVAVASGKGKWEFLTTPVERLELQFEGIAGSRHIGWTRPSDVRAPYVPRQTPIRNTRAVSIVSTEDMAAAAAALDLDRIDPCWIGANVVIEGIDRLSFLPRGTHLMFEGGAILIVEDQNHPCRIAGKRIQDHVPERSDIELGFPKLAKGRRGLVASVEKPGSIATGEAVEALIPEQWVYD
jgi:hypothetical protein